MAIINQIVKGSGTTPTGSISITNNGTYDVTDKATAVVNVPTTAPALYREFQLDANGKLLSNKTTTHIMDFTGMTDVDAYLLAYAYSGNTAISGAVDMSDLIMLSGMYACQYMFQGCTGLTGADLSSLTTVSSNSSCSSMFSYCSYITSINLSALTTVSGTSGCVGMFNGCIRLTSVSLPALISVPATNGCMGMFAGCTGLTSMTYPVLTNIPGGKSFSRTFNGCTNLASLSFPALTSTSFGTQTTQFNNMLDAVTGCTVHFPSNLQSVIGSWADVVAGFGGINTTVLFDLPATES